MYSFCIALICVCNCLSVTIISGCQLDEKVDIYADLDGQCKRGLKVQYDGNKQYVGTGQLKMLRHELYDNGVQAK